MIDPGSRIHTPRYLLRRHIILQLLRHYEPGRFLEIGCGRGELMPWLARRGYEGVGLEISETVFPIAEAAVRPYEPHLRVVDNPEPLQGQQFEYVLAFEVLEHIADDRAALREWRDWLRPNGVLMLSVPAHMSKWTEADEVGGHYRRYERDGLRSLLEGCGYTVDVFWNYGFPLTSLTWRIRPLLYKERLRELEGMEREERTLRSSLESTHQVKGFRLLNLIMEGAGAVFHLAQRPFRHADLGDGYLVACRLS